MFHQNTYDLMRLHYDEYNLKLNQLYTPVEVKPGLIQRATSSLSKMSKLMLVRRTAKPQPNAQSSRGTAVAK